MLVLAGYNTARRSPLGSVPGQTYSLPVQLGIGDFPLQVIQSAEQLLRARICRLYDVSLLLVHHAMRMQTDCSTERKDEFAALVSGNAPAGVAPHVTRSAISDLAESGGGQ